MIVLQIKCDKYYFHLQQAAGGTFSAVVNLMTLAGGSDAVSSALVYFLIAAVITVLSLISYMCLHFMVRHFVLFYEFQAVVSE